MGAGSIWHWGILILLFVVFPAVVIATERSRKRVNRARYLLALVVTLIIAVVPPLLLAMLDPNVAEGVQGISTLANIAAWIWFLRTVVKRLRDTAHPKALGYLSCIPVLNLAFFLYLLVPASKADPAVHRVSPLAQPMAAEEPRT